jgi:hypothetical protein
MAESLYRGQVQLFIEAIESTQRSEKGGFSTEALGGTGYDLMDIAPVLLAEVGTIELRDKLVEKLPNLKVSAAYTNWTRFFDTLDIVNPYHIKFLLRGWAICIRTALAQIFFGWEMDSRDEKG